MLRESSSPLFPKPALLPFNRGGLLTVTMSHSITENHDQKKQLWVLTVTHLGNKLPLPNKCLLSNKGSLYAVKIVLDAPLK